MRQIAAIGLAMLVAVGVTACGDDVTGSGDASEPAILEATDTELRSIESADLDFTFAGSTDPATKDATARPTLGFSMKGPFSFDSDGELPIAELVYTRLAGAASTTATFVSTGSAAFVRTDNGTYEVPAERLGGLKLKKGDEQTTGLEQLSLAEWFLEPKVERKGDTDVVTGQLKAHAAFADLAALARQLGVPDTAELQELSEEDQATLDKMIDRSSVRLVTGHDDHVLRSLKASIDLKADVEESARAKLGPLGGARLVLELSLARVNQPVKVEAPADAKPLP
jgi:hypothetical protein